MRYLLILLLLTPIPAAAQGQNCGPTPLVHERLQTKYEESPMVEMVRGNLVYTLWTNLDSGSWTITFPFGPMLTCLLGSGQDFSTQPTVLTPVEPEGDQL